MKLARITEYILASLLIYFIGKMFHWIVDAFHLMVGKEHLKRNVLI